MHIQRNTEAPSCNNGHRGIAISSTYSECVSVAIQHAVAFYVTYFHLVRVAVRHFSSFSYKRHDFKKKEFIEHKFLFWFLPQFCLKHQNLRIIQQRVIMNVHGSSCKELVILVRFSSTLNFGKYSNIIFHENSSSGSRVFPCGQTNRRTCRHGEANRRFWQSQNCEMRLKSLFIWVSYQT